VSLVVRIPHVVQIAAARGSGQDRARVFELEDGLVVVLADGAGGTGNGAAAAEAIVEAVGAATSAAHDWSGLLDGLDADAQRLGNGQSTAVIISVRGGVLSGASVGDSGSWLLRGTDVVDLTEGQQRKPLVGSGCVPWPIAPTGLDGGTLLVASDGLLRYSKRTDIVRLASGADLQAAARALIDVVRLPNGELQDDVAVVLCRQLS
jgi:serine/threonine protein phosphatase PrpC